MSVGKYSPTVSTAYATDQNWWNKLCAENELYDADGYDSYGYHKDTEKDRAGWTEWDYLSDTYDAGEYLSYPRYEHVSSEWTFDGVRPVRRK